MNTKSIWQSKTFWLAVAQGVAGILVVLLAQDPNLQGVGWLAIVKSIIDSYLRANTNSVIQ